MLRGMVFKNFVHFKDRFVFDFSKNDNGPSIFVGASSTGKTAALELIRRCMDSTLNSSLTNRAEKNERAYVFCEFDIDIDHYGTTVITGMIVQGNGTQKKLSSTLDNNLEKKEITEICDRNDMFEIENSIEDRKEDKEDGEKNRDEEEEKKTMFHKLIMYMYKKKIKFSFETYLENRDGSLVNIRKNALHPEKLLDGIRYIFCRDRKDEQVNPVSEGIKDLLNDEFVGKVVSEIKNAIETDNQYQTLWREITEKFVGILPSRGLGSIQWTKSISMNNDNKSQNYKDSCARAEILNELIKNKCINEREEEKIFRFLTSPNTFDFEKKLDSTNTEERDSTKTGGSDSTKKEEPDSAKTEETDSTKTGKPDSAKKEPDSAKTEGSDSAKMDERVSAKTGEPDSSKKENPDSAKKEPALIFVTHGAKKFPLLKTPIGIVEAKQFSLLMAHTTLKTICFEEPDRGMHPHMIERLKDVLHEKSKNKTVIVVTHNPYLIDLMSFENTYIFYKSGNAAYAKNLSEIEECKALRKIFLMEDLKRIIFSSYVLFVEGRSDKIFMQSFIKHLTGTQEISEEGKVNIRNYEIVSLGGKDNRKIVTDFCKSIAINYCFILDQDAFIKTKKENKDEIAEIVEYPDYEVEKCELKKFQKGQEFLALSERLKKDKNTFIWEDGELEDFLLSGKDAWLKIKEKLKLDRRKGKQKQKNAIKEALKKGLSPEQSQGLADVIKDFKDTSRLQTFLKK